MNSPVSQPSLSDQLTTERVVAMTIGLASIISRKRFYPYQVEFATRFITSVINREGEVLTALFARQSGKTEIISALLASIGMLFPELAKWLPNDPRFNYVNSNGTYMGWKHGIRIGIYAPKLDQSGITFNRLCGCLNTDEGASVMRELGITYVTANGNTIRLSNGTRILSESASEQSKIEGETHDILVLEECQDIGTQKIRKSCHPMVASTKGTIVKIGTATKVKGDFYEAIRNNERTYAATGVRNHFCYPYFICQEFNSAYKDYIDKEKKRIFEDSDEFKMSYKCEWILERGMFITTAKLCRPDIAVTLGDRSKFYFSSPPWRTSQVAGIDWGKEDDSTVVCVVDVDWTTPAIELYKEDYERTVDFTAYNKHVLAWLVMNGDDYETQFYKVVEFIERFKNLRKIVCDSNSIGAPMFDRLSATLEDHLVVPFNFTPQLKSEGYNMFATDLTAGRFTYPASQLCRETIHHRQFITQMLDLEKSYRNSLLHVSHPDVKGAHDDYPDAAMLANWGANTPANSMEIEVANENIFI